ncbi:MULTISPECIES: AbrB/MazE/SpoVT family DNA-binding domain-containing protein [Leptospira]|uniref:Addiction module antidote protein n=4 Tax=Leptospira kirschneri TaxID=29507 RepID=A0A1T1DH32_9LEPT|nr:MULTISPECIES: AbrB/MazE/SpoVT family DNA-binding domain-containing protein [Leptospira]EKO15532.1 putative addiction module antidote [Leptospira kirschneri str. H1]EKO50786.1 putative addiction module antidote [Leptospira kirschneri str. 200802841]EMK09341.1 putative addiction module antidote [Leptospira kirschneri]EMK26294.1 putative addiction module antidote [Leptospira kirschneri serovar Bulgarica str. Nikolaevo]EMN26537.1 putative addiction module antidote [Leptospira kirschneri serovar
MDNSSVKKTTIRAIGNSAGATIPKALLEKYNFHEGDTVFLLETESGILLSPYDPDFEEAMDIYQKGSKKYRNALRELAK